MAFKDRVKELRRVRAGDLIANPKNFRGHPESQRKLLHAVLEEVGIAGVNLVRELPDGRLMLIDGHMRTDMDPEEIWPVAVTDLDEEEADKILATFDPISAMASIDEEKHAELCAQISSSHENMQAFLAKVIDTQFEPAPVPPDSQSRLDQKTPVICPECGHAFVAK